MKYIIYNKETNKVIHILNKMPVSFSDCLDVARCETIPSGKKFIVTNIQTVKEEFITRTAETVTLETGMQKEIVRAVTNTRHFKTCDLIAEN